MKKYKKIVLLLPIRLLLICFFAVGYSFANFCNSKIDVVIPVAVKDKYKLEKSLKGILTNSKNPINKIYIVAEDLKIRDSISLEDERIVWLSEKIYPFSKKDIENLLVSNSSTYAHASWYYQQLLKFYVFEAIPDISDNALILDSDFVFIRPVEFVTDDGKAILSYGYPFKWLTGTSTYPNSGIEHSHIHHARTFVKDWDIVNPFSGMHHHMVFNREIMSELFKNVEQHNKEPFWKAFVSRVNLRKWTSASEYVIYFHFASKKFRDKIELRHLNTIDIIYDSKDIESQNSAHKLLNNFIQNAAEDGVLGVGCHGFLDLKKRLETMDYIPTLLRETMLAKRESYYILKLKERGELFVN
jgi:hypothetical protein